MKLNSLKLQHFKNYSNLQIEFAAGINCILGKNGMGKTNMLDAIHYIAMTRSALNSIDQQNINHGEKFFAINSELEKDGKPLKVNCYYEQGKKKVIKVDGKEPEKLSDHIGEIPCVLITPDDTEIIREGSEVRRKFIDSVISQHDRSYLDKLIAMQRVLKQRNSFLKSNEGKLNIDKRLLDVYDEVLMPLFGFISKRRRRFVEEFIPFFTNNYRLIFEGKEEVTISYKSDLHKENFGQIYADHFQKDIILQRTGKGAHKDDYEFQLNEKPVKKFASQGQQKSFVIALKLAEYDYLKSAKAYNPLLLLDDVFDKFDDERIERLIKLLMDKDRFSQIFLTDARAERSKTFFKGNDQVKFFEVNNNGAIE